MSSADPTGSPRTFQTRQGVVVALVDIADGSRVQAIAADAFARPRFNAWGWGIHVGRPPRPTNRLTYRFPAALTATLAWEPTMEGNMADALAAMWRWQAGEPVALLRYTTTDEGHALTQNEQKEAVDRWGQEIMPASAQIIRSLYCPDGNWEHCEKTWAFAAAKLVRGWLAFYAREDMSRTHDRRHTANRLLLWRTYALVLGGIARGGEQWSSDQQEEVEQACGEWLRICQDEASAWLFQRAGEEWWGQGRETTRRARRAGLVYREYRREAEVNRVVEVLHTLIAETRDEEHRRALLVHLEQVVENWYLPRYEVESAQGVQEKGYKATGETWFGRQKRRLFQGKERMWAGIVVGYIATAFEGGVWDMFAFLARQAEWVWGAFVLIPGLLTLCYLQRGIQRKTYRNFTESLGRAAVLWSWSEGFAVAAGVGVAWIVIPSLLNQRPTWSDILLLVPPYAQLALFIGIFTQLIFDERPTTAPLDAP
ncbi:MAG: hypothetical protein HC884_06005 [Chloroflexaceae bacterium]|nr:hypothetical protein [Chloroflexaceae bacterium]